MIEVPRLVCGWHRPQSFSGVGVVMARLGIRPPPQHANVPAYFVSIYLARVLALVDITVLSKGEVGVGEWAARNTRQTRQGGVACDIEIGHCEPN